MSKVANVTAPPEASELEALASRRRVGEQWSRTSAARRRRSQVSAPRVGFLGLGWIGRNRMQAITRSGLVEVAALSDTSVETALQAAQEVPRAEVLDSFDQLLELDLDGIVIATPSALHADQAARALERGVAVFCQKPLGRNGDETARVIEIARRKNRLLQVDLSYRFITCLREVNALCINGELGDVYAVDLMFHNAYGPDKAWFYDRKLSGGGCVIDLGIHLVDLAFWNLGSPKVTHVSSHLFSHGKPCHASREFVEDYAVATLRCENGATVRLACSWKLPAGCDAIISGSFFGTRGGAAFHNVNGSFYDFTAERFRGTKRETLSCDREDWGGRAAVHWARQLAGGGEFDPAIEQLNEVARALDAVYQSA
ncbi:MAG TPA: Gfo/Idh/MocA family oxidoreductase [Candidatus Dormibacteraeota bacterium]|nr:Gfo/Idh/MocA family oxidoreductase [Candidatus Dormibacteraeota bacterium]